MVLVGPRAAEVPLEHEPHGLAVHSVPGVPGEGGGGEGKWKERGKGGRGKVERREGAMSGEIWVCGRIMSFWDGEAPQISFP